MESIIYKNIIGTRKNLRTEIRIDDANGLLNPMWHLFILSLNEDEEDDALSYWNTILTILNVDEDSLEWDYDFTELNDLYGY